MKLNNAVVKGNGNTIFKMLVFFALTLNWDLAIADPSSAINITGKAASDDFGRLFTAQYERNAIDRARLNGGFIPAPVTGVDENTTTLPSTMESTQPIKLLGVLLRADGKNKVWLSGGTGAQQNLLNGRSIIGNINQSANLKVGVNSAAILKPGQVWSANTGRQEAYQIPVPKPIVTETAPNPKPEQPRSNAVSSAAQASSVNSSEVQSSVQSSTK